MRVQYSIQLAVVQPQLQIKFHLAINSTFLKQLSHLVHEWYEVGVVLLGDVRRGQDAGFKQKPIKHLRVEQRDIVVAVLKELRRAFRASIQQG